MPPYVREIPVRFGDCDPAGIAYYPSILHMQHVVFEGFWEEGLGMPYARLIGDRRLGFPTRRLDAGFRSPLRFGERLRWAVTVGAVGRSSVEFRYAVGPAGGDPPAVSVRAFTVCVDMDSFRPVPVPSDLRAAFARFADSSP